MKIWQFIIYNTMTFFHEKMQSRLNLPEKDLHGTATIFSRDLKLSLMFQVFCIHICF